MKKFKLGQVVQLRSGGPHMTVEKSKKREAQCCWFVHNEVRRNQFPVKSLKTKKR